MRRHISCHDGVESLVRPIEQDPAVKLEWIDSRSCVDGSSHGEKGSDAAGQRPVPAGRDLWFGSVRGHAARPCGMWQ